MNIGKYIFCKESDKDFLIFNKNILFAQRAPEPMDLQWENLSFDDRNLLRRRILSSFLTLLILILCFGLNLSVSFGQDNISNTSKVKKINGIKISKEEEIKTWTLSSVASIIIIILNYCLVMIIEKMASYEKHLSRTNQSKAFGMKLLIVKYD